MPHSTPEDDSYESDIISHIQYTAGKDSEREPSELGKKLTEIRRQLRIQGIKN